MTLDENESWPKTRPLRRDPIDREPPRLVYVGSHVELAAIVAAVLRWVQVDEALPRGDKTSERRWLVPRPTKLIPGAFETTDLASLEMVQGKVDEFERDRIVCFGMAFEVWRKRE